MELTITTSSYPMPQKITHILFDLGNVLVELNGMPFIRGLYAHMSDREIHAKWQSLKCIDDYESGRSTRQAFLAAAPRELGLEMSAEQFADLFASWMVGPFGGAVELVESLRDSYRVGCLSNTSEIHIGKLKRQSSLMGGFHDTFLSYEMGILKPKYGAYQHVLNKWGVEAQEILFLDDNQDNIEAASSIGFIAVKTEGLDQAKAVCSRLLDRS